MRLILLAMLALLSGSGDDKCKCCLEVLASKDDCENGKPIKDGDLTRDGLAVVGTAFNDVSAALSLIETWEKECKLHLPKELALKTSRRGTPIADKLRELLDSGRICAEDPDLAVNLKDEIGATTFPAQYHVPAGSSKCYVRIKRDGTAPEVAIHLLPSVLGPSQQSINGVPFSETYIPTIAAALLHEVHHVRTYETANREMVHFADKGALERPAYEWSSQELLKVMASPKSSRSQKAAVGEYLKACLVKMQSY